MECPSETTEKGTSYLCDAIETFFPYYIGSRYKKNLSEVKPKNKKNESGKYAFQNNFIVIGIFQN